jgi:hypothetical protein
MNKVVITTFKYTGKWYDKIVDETSFKVFEHAEIVAEMREKYPEIDGFNYTIKITNVDDTVINLRMVVNGVR